MSTTLVRPTSVSARTRRVRILVTTALVSAAGFAVVVVVAGLLETGYSPRSEGISALASTQSEVGGLMTLGFGLLAVTALTSGVALLLTMEGRAGRAAGTLVLFAGVCTVTCGLARQSCSTLQQSCLDREHAGDVTTSHTVHNLAALPLLASLTLAAFLIAAALHRDARRRHLARRVRLAACVGAACFVWFGSGSHGDNGGLVQRAMVLVAYGIPVAVAWRVTRADLSR